MKVYENSMKCPSCNEKMWYSRKGRIYFRWISLMDRDVDIVSHFMCPKCSSVWDRWTGEKAQIRVESKNETVEIGTD